VLMPAGNCPKYLNKKHIIPNVPQPRLVSDSIPLVQEAIDLLARADMFFISSSNHESDMDTNHRGGPAGFVRLESNETDNCTLVYPEYSGNRLYQTLGNLSTTPKAGLVFPDFSTGNVLYVTGTTEILVRENATKVLPHSNMVVRIKVEAARFVEKGLSFRGIQGEPSPYNPPVRYLTREKHRDLLDNEKQIYANLVDKKQLTPTIARFRFHIADPEKASRWKPGQYVALSFADELDVGYSHMRDDDPKSLNDDFLRTFTVSSSPGDLSEYDQFEITIRKVGPVTEHLFRTNPKSQLQIPLRGFGGEFIFQQDNDEHIGCVAGGIGITPLLAQAPVLDLSRLRLYWTIRAEDLGLVLDTFDHFPDLIGSTRLFVTGQIDDTATKNLQKLQDLNTSLENRRLTVHDLKLGSEHGELVMKWYICTGDSLQKTLLAWLKGRTVLSESFNY
jgi:NAD(P)H-flavin reductase